MSSKGEVIKQFLQKWVFKNEQSTPIHMKMYGGKDVTVSPYKDGGAFLNIPNAYGKDKGWGIGINQNEYEKFISLDESQQRKFIDDYINKYNSEVYNELKKSEKKDLQQRIATHSPYTSDGHKIKYPEDHNPALSPNYNKVQGRFKQYPDEPLNPRISRVTPFVDENEVILNMVVDGKEKTLSISNKNTVDAYHAGALPLYVLANKALELTESMQADLHSRFELSMDEQRDREQEQSQGFHR